MGYTRVTEHGYRYPLVDNDPPEHTRARRAVQNQFSPAAMARLRPAVRQAATGLVDAAAAMGEVEAVTALAQPLPDLTIRLLTGIEPPDPDTMASWGDAVGRLASADADPWHSELATDSLEWLAAKGVPALPEHCMGRVIMDSGGEDGRLAEDGLERLMMLDSIWLAGIDSSGSLLANAINAFAEFPDQWDAVRERPALIPNAVEEVMRWDAPFRSFYRRTLAPANIGGVDIPADADVCVIMAAANRDPDRFADPDRFDVTRPDARAHLAFGASIHLCLGAPVARLETVEFLTALAGRVRRFERTGEAVRSANQAVRKFSSLPVRLVPA
ncbi:cytochrome P450 [Streptomyces sp. SL13]|uniref:Cytochrome P450 n=1 Tax=Streptantibioticus silvisoli TaxID=2705255 RepID=A0AA90HFN8_9ACTN|nr:cytochrome P450 [Streptantibioticus silvisoli]MDI5974077.1 cytochrome P450 [Streptantibioticus silvisoli]